MGRFAPNRVQDGEGHRMCRQTMRVQHGVSEHHPGFSPCCLRAFKQHGCERKVSLIYQLRQGVAALFGCPTASPRLPRPLAGSRVRESAARDYWVKIRLVLSAAFTSQVPGDAASVPCTAPSPAPPAQPQSVGRSALLAQLFVRCP